MRESKGLADERGSNPKRVLIGCVAPDDPISERGERPLVTAAWALQPDRVDLIYSPSTNDAYKKTNSYLWTECGIRERHPWFIDISNPTRVEEFIDPLINILQQIQQSVDDPEAEYHIVESAAPQLRTVLMLGTVSRVIHAHIWHVDDPPEEERGQESKTGRNVPPAEKQKRAQRRMVKVDLSRFDGAALRFFRNIRLHLEVKSAGTADERIHCEIVPELWLKRNPQAGPMKLLLELCKARTGEAYNVRQSGGWLHTSRLAGLILKSSARTLAVRSINEEVSGFDLPDPRLKQLIEARGSTQKREYRVALEPHEIFIEYT
jgi:hypothetical protein